MSAKTLTGLTWYRDPDAGAAHEPGIVHSYLASLATALHYIDGELDPVWLAGASGFAFRIWVNEAMCPSATSIFDWQRILPEAVEQAGRCSRHVSRLWHEGDKEAERRREAERAIIQGIDHGAPAAVWDIFDGEWGLIVGYDTDTGKHQTRTCCGEPSTLLFSRLGRNGIDILSVIIPLAPNGRTREEIVRRSLEAAASHAEQNEWMDRPTYQDGLPAYDVWATTLERWGPPHQCREGWQHQAGCSVVG